MSFLKNLFLLALVLILSYFVTSYFGLFYGYFSPVYDDSMIGLSKQSLVSIDGFPFAYIFFTILLFRLFGQGNKKNWIIWLLIPAGLFFGSGDLKHIYLPIALGLIAYGLAKVLRIIYQKVQG